MNLDQSLIKLICNEIELSTEFTAENYNNDYKQKIPVIKVIYAPIKTKNQVDALMIVMNQSYLFTYNNEGTVYNDNEDKLQNFTLKIVPNLFFLEVFLPEVFLPECFGYIVVEGDLNLQGNNISTLPESFGNIKVGGSLYLNNNSLKTLPESFGNITVGGSLYLNNNYLKTLPESFGNIKVGGSLYLNWNSLETLPESFGNIKVGGSLILYSNSLKTLPESFGNIEVGRDLNLSWNTIGHLPDNFGDIKVGRDLILYSNQIFNHMNKSEYDTETNRIINELRNNKKVGSVQFKEFEKILINSTINSPINKEQ